MLNWLFKFSWSRGYNRKSSYYHQIGSINLSCCCHRFPWLSAWGVCTIICCRFHTYTKKTGLCFFVTVQSYDVRKWPSNYRPMVVFVILQITPFHYHHYADVSENIELPKCFSVQSVVCVSKIKPILSINMMIVRIFTLSNYQCQIGSMSHLPLLRVRSWNNGIPCKPFYVLIMTLWHGNIFRVTCPLWRESTSHRGILRRNEW